MPAKSSVFSLQSSARKKLEGVFGNWKLEIGNSWRSQAGVAQLALVLLLLAGVAVGTYVVQHQTNLIPHAQEAECTNLDADGNCLDEQAGDELRVPLTNNIPGGVNNQETAESCAGKSHQECQGDKQVQIYYVFDGGQCKPNSPETIGKCTNNSPDNPAANNQSSSGNSACSDDLTYCDNGKAIRKHGGYYDPTHSLADKSGCVYDFYNIPAKDSECSSEKKAKNGDVVSMTSGENQQYDQNRGQGGSANTTATCESTTVCKKGKKVRNIANYDPNDDTKCIRTTQETNEDCGTQKDSSGKEVPIPDGTVLKEDQTTKYKAQIQAEQAQRAQLKTELDEAKAQVSSNADLVQKITKAQGLMDQATAKFNECFKDGQTPESDACRGVSQAAHDQAVASARVALFDAVGAGVPNTCVKVDMAVGKNNSNSLIEVKPVENLGGDSRLFMCRGKESSSGAKDGDIKWRVRDSKGVLQPVSPESLTKLGLKEGLKDIKKIPQDFVDRRNNAAKLADQPASTLTNSTSSTDWKEVPLSSCQTACISFPAGALCYKKGNTDQYNCDGQQYGNSNGTGVVVSCSKCTSSETCYPIEKGPKYFCLSKTITRQIPASCTPACKTSEWCAANNVCRPIYQ